MRIESDGEKGGGGVAGARFGLDCSWIEGSGGEDELE
jgi:hypothetical protein